MKAIGYLRVSTEEQAGRGASIALQRDKVEQYAQLYGLDVVAWVEDAGVSAKTLDRPGLNRALAMLASGEAEALIVHKLDRLTRVVAHLGQLLDGPFRRSALLSVSEQIDCRSAGGRMVLNILSSIAQWERETISERVTSALGHLKSQGRRVGAVPYGCRSVVVGHKPDGKAIQGLERCPVEGPVVELVERLRAAGMRPKAICAELAARGYASRNGRPFVSQQVIRMAAA